MCRAPAGQARPLCSFDGGRCRNGQCAEEDAATAGAVRQLGRVFRKCAVRGGAGQPLRWCVKPLLGERALCASTHAASSVELSVSFCEDGGGDSDDAGVVAAAVSHLCSVFGNGGTRSSLGQPFHWCVKPSLGEYARCESPAAVESVEPGGRTIDVQRDFVQQIVLAGMKAFKQAVRRGARFEQCTGLASKAAEAAARLAAAPVLAIGGGTASSKKTSCTHFA